MDILVGTVRVDRVLAGDPPQNFQGVLGGLSSDAR